MLFSVFYLSLFLSVGLLSARRAVPDGSAAVIVPLGCGFGVSLLAVLPALFAVVLGFTLPAVALAAVAAAGIGAALLYRGTRLRGMAKDPDSGALWACLLPVVLITLYLLHTHVLHLVDGAYHTGQSCYGDMPMHLGFIKYIAQSGEFLPRYPLLGGTHRFGYPFLCETVSSVFVVLGADLRDGTPIYDIKPYIPFADCHPDATGGWIEDAPWQELDVEFPQTLQDKVPSAKLPGLVEVLRQDPRRAGSKHEPNRVYHLAFAGLDISFTVDETQLTVVAVNDAQD